MKARLTFSRTFKISGLAVVLGIAQVIVFPEGNFFFVIGIFSMVLGIPVFTVSALRHLLRTLLWRVGSRLFVSYLLIGVLPLPFLAGLLFAGLTALCGQLGVTRATRGFQETRRELRRSATQAAGRFAQARTQKERAGILEQAAGRDAARDAARGAAGVRVLYALYSPDSGGLVESYGPLKERTELPQAVREKTGVLFAVKQESTVFVATAERLPDASLLFYTPLDSELVARVEDETGIVIKLAVATVEKPTSGVSLDSEPGPGRSRRSGVTIQAGSEKISLANNLEITSGRPKEAPDPKNDSPAGLFKSRWVAWFGVVEWPLVEWETGMDSVNQRLLVTVRTSIERELGELFWQSAPKTGEQATGGRAVYLIMKALSLVAVSVYAIASIIAAVLVFRIARATRRLSDGFDEIEKGNFAHRAKLRGQDQLAGLIDSFNQMASHLEESIQARARQKAVEHELALARDLQQRLLPSPDFCFPGVEIAADFKPAAAIGGDFYHLVAEGEKRLSVVMADVSGHGLATGIVMASAKASLSSLARSGARTSEMLASLDEEIRRTTDERTFVTLAHLLFSFDKGVVEYTNAGHVYPYRVDASGTVVSIENPARPLGRKLPASFKTVEVPLVPGDVWVLLSDGIIEAQDENGDVFGFERLESVLAACARQTAPEIRDEVLRNWRLFTGRDEPEDDRTLLVLRLKREDPAGS